MSSDCKLSIDVDPIDEYMEEDQRTSNIIFDEPSDFKSPMSPKLRGMGLDLSFTAAERKRDGAGVQEEGILVVFDLPDGSQGESVFKLGQTVEFLKSFVESEYGILMQDQKIIFEGKEMMDPLSILDYPEVKGVFFYFTLQK